MKKIACCIYLLGLIFLRAGIAQNPSLSSDVLGNRPRVGTSSIPSGIRFPAAGNPWLPIGPFGGDISDMAVNPVYPEKVFAAGGVPYVSEDGGAHWTILTTLSAISSGSVNSIESTNNGIMIATGPATFAKIFRSADGGTTWASRTIPVNSTGLCVAVDPQDTNTIYVGLASNLSASSNKVIVKSNNGGLNWTAIDMTSTLPVGYGVIDICVDPSNSQTIFAIGRSGISDAAVVASFDGGHTWEVRTNNLPFGKPYNMIRIAGQKVLLAGGQLFGSQNVGVYQSTDWGLNWTNISADFPNKVSNALLINPSDTNRIYVGTEGDGIYSTSDGGSTWNYNTGGAGDKGAVRALIFHPSSTDTIYAGYLSIAVCKSTDAGQHWDYSNTGIATLTINDIEVDRLNPSRIIIGFEAENSGGCYLSSDTGTNWTLLTTMPATRYSKVSVGGNGYLYAWSNGPSSIAQEGLYKSMDNGLTWYNMGPNIGNLFETEIWSLTISQDNPGLIFIGGNNFGNNGWEPMIYRSTDGGQTWVNVYKGSPDNYESIKYLFIEPGSQDQVIFATYKSELQGGILKSSDGGTTWNSISDGITGSEKWFGAIICDPDSTNKLFVGLGGYGNHGRIYISEDSGMNWSLSSLNVGTYSKIADLVINPENSDIIYAATTQDGVYVSSDGGHTWEHGNDGIPTAQVSAFSDAFHTSSGWELLASTYTSSAFSTRIFTPGAGIGDIDINKPSVRAYPNPCNGLINIDLSSIKDPIEKIEFRDITGRIIFQYTGSTLSTNGMILVKLPVGLFICRVYTAKGCSSFKVCSVK